MTEFQRLSVCVIEGQPLYVCCACERELQGAGGALGAGGAPDAAGPWRHARLLEMLRQWQRRDGRCQVCEVTYGIPAIAAPAADADRGRSPWANAS